MRMNPSVHDTMRTFISNRQSALTQAIKQLSKAGGTPDPSQQEMATFFRDFMSGGWDVFEEVSVSDSVELKEIASVLLALSFVGEFIYSSPYLPFAT